MNTLPPRVLAWSEERHYFYIKFDIITLVNLYSIVNGAAGWIFPGRSINRHFEKACNALK